MRISATEVNLAVPLFLAASLGVGSAKSRSETVEGYVLDSACAFTKDLDKPSSLDCDVACAKAGSPWVILAANGTI